MVSNEISSIGISPQTFIISLASMSDNGLSGFSALFYKENLAATSSKEKWENMLLRIDSDCFCECVLRPEKKESKLKRASIGASNRRFRIWLTRRVPRR